MSNTLAEVAQKSNTILYTIHTVFPFTPFVDTMELTLTKVNIIYRSFFFTSTTTSFMIEDIMNVKVDTTLLFGTITLELTRYENNPPALSFLPRNAAIQFRDMAMGLIEAKKEGVQLEQVPTKVMRRELELIGQPPAAT